MASPFALITGEALISGSLESWRCENMPHTQERWADGGDASAWSPECQPTGNGLDLDSLLCDETPSTVSVMQKGFFGPDEGAPTPTRTSLRTLDLKNVHFDLDGVEEVRPSPEAILETKLDRLAFLARADVKCAAHAAGRRDDRQAAITSPFALITGGALIGESPPATAWGWAEPTRASRPHECGREQPGLRHGQCRASADALRLDAAGHLSDPGRHMDTSTALQRWLEETAAAEASRAVGQSGGGEWAAAAAAWACEQAAATHAGRTAGSDSEGGALCGEVPADGLRRSPAVSSEMRSEMSGRVEEHRGALAAGPKTPRRAAVSPPAPARYPSISATWHCPALPDVSTLQAAEPPAGPLYRPLPRVGTWRCLVDDVHSLLGCQTQ